MSLFVTVDREPKTHLKYGVAEATAGLLCATLGMLAPLSVPGFVFTLVGVAFLINGLYDSIFAGVAYAVQAMDSEEAISLKF